MATDININQLIINKLTKAQYQAAKEAGQIVDTELYVITDDEDYLDEKYAPLYTYGTEDIGTSGTVLETGKLHFVYEIDGSSSGGGADTPSVPTLIDFTIGITDYQAEEGMTWAQWCDSEYNTCGCIYEGVDGWIYGETLDHIVSTNSIPIIASDIITSGTNYTWMLDPNYEE